MLDLFGKFAILDASFIQARTFPRLIPLEFAILNAGFILAYPFGDKKTILGWNKKYRQGRS
jgi:hypothetical protein